MMTELLHRDLTGRIIGVYYFVYNKLSQTYPEFIYERAMIALLERLGIRCIWQDEYEIRYKGRLVGVQQIDIFVAGAVVVELKVAGSIEPIHLAQLLSYLKTVSREVGLLFRFGGPEPEFARRVLTTKAWHETLSPDSTVLTEREDLLHPEVTHEIIGGVLEVFKTLGPGFIHRIYANACFHELKLRGLEVMPRREFRVFMDDIDLGEIKLGHLQVDNRALVFPVAVSNIEKIKIANLKAWMRHLNIPIGILANFNTTWLEPIVLRT
jgi:GxxExxY protein